MRVNAKATDYRVDINSRLAGGGGVYAAKQSAYNLLRRNVLSCLLWEDLAYQGGKDTADSIWNLVPDVAPHLVAELAIEARTKQHLRHVPLWIACRMASLDSHKHLVGNLLPQIILRPDELTEFVALYWKDGRTPLSGQVKKGLARSFDRFSEYQFAKYDRNTTIKLRDVMFMVHPNPKGKDALFKCIAERTLATPDTWEVELSAYGNNAASWERLITENKLGGLAFLRNLRNMTQAGVPRNIIIKGLEQLNTSRLVPLNFYTAAQHAPEFAKQLEEGMCKVVNAQLHLPGYTVLVVDVSGSMGKLLSRPGTTTRLDVAKALASVASVACEDVAIYATAGDDYKRIHATKKVSNLEGFAVAAGVNHKGIGKGGIFTRQALEFIRDAERGNKVDRIIVFSDSQDCDYPGKRVPAPFGKYNYICDVSAHSRGIAYDGVWTAEISGWSDNFLTYIQEMERLQ